MPPVVVPSSTFALLPSAGTPGSLARVTDRGGLWMDQNTHWSPVGAGVVNAKDFPSLQAAIDSLPPEGGTVMLPPGTYTLTSPLDLDGSRRIALVGMGRHYGPSKILLDGSGTSVISCRGAEGLGLHNLHIYYKDERFTGHVVDLENAALCVIADCHLGCEHPDKYTATSLIYMSSAYTIVIDRNNFAQCQTAILGITDTLPPPNEPQPFCNVIQIFGNHFSSDIAMCGIRNAGQCWLIQGNTFEPLAYADGQNVPRPVAAYTQSYGSLNVTFDSNWFGDGTHHGTWISWFGSGLTVSNNYMSSGSTAVRVNGSSCYGINVTGNFFAGSQAGNLAAAVDLNAEPNAQTGVVIEGNVFESSVTTPIANLHATHKQVSVHGNFYANPADDKVIVRGADILLQGQLRGPIWVRLPSSGNVAMLESPGAIGVEAHIRPQPGKRGLLTFTEDSIADRWAVGTKPGDANLYFGTGNSIANTDRVIVRPDGGITLTGLPRFNGTNTTGAVTASLGSNCPASTSSTPYTWIAVTTQDGSTAYVPCWK
jgi:hypothetical protein